MSCCCYVTVLGGEKACRSTVTFVWHSSLTSSNQGFCHYWGQGLIVAKSGVMMSSWANSASSFPWFSGSPGIVPWGEKSNSRLLKKDLCKYDPTKINLIVPKIPKTPGSKGSKFLKLNMDVIGILTSPHLYSSFSIWFEPKKPLSKRVKRCLQKHT